MQSTQHVQRDHTKRREGGFTMVELMIVIVITAILLSLATPNLSGLLARNQLLGQTNEITTALATARSEAVSRGVRAGACLSDDETTCRANVPGAGWIGSIIVYADTNRSNTLSNADPILRVYRTFRDMAWFMDGTEIQFTAEGYAVTPGQNVGALSSFTVCHDDASQNDLCRLVTIRPSGIVTVTNATYPGVN